MKPLFIPLMRKHYEAFADGSKVTEYRLHGNRWNESCCQIGREVTLSKGYGKKHRLHGIVTSFESVWTTDLPEPVQDSIKEIYGTGNHLIAAIGIQVATIMATR